MDLNLSPRHIDFRDECRTWLAEHHPGRIASMDTPEGEKSRNIVEGRSMSKME